MPSKTVAVSALVLTLLVGACAPSSPSASSGANTSAPAAAGAGASTAPRQPKILTMAIATELASFGDFAGGGGSGGGCGECRAFAHDHLTEIRPDGTVDARLAVEVPSLENGLWKLNPDGSMDMTWKLRPGITWHDGTPFTSQDLLFTLALYKDPELPNLYAGQLQMIESATAPDPQTFIVHWSQTFVRAHRQPALEPMPRHLLEELQQRGDKAGLNNSPRLTNEFIGVGPYRLSAWESGSHIEFTRYENYYLGRPPLDRVIVQFIKDPNTLIANVLAGALDAGSHNSVDLAAGLDLRQRWQGTNNRVELEPTGMAIMVQMQFRPEYQKLRSAFGNRTVRQALYHAIDRATLNEVMMAGLAPLADSWLPPEHEQRRDIESAIPQYAYDVPRARQLLTEASWTPGSDGVLTHAPSGDRFEIELWAKARYNDKPLSVIADGWKGAGVQASLHPIPAARDSDREFEVTYPHAIFTNPPAAQFFEDYRLHGGYVAGTPNRWTGRNQPGYANPRFDALLDRLQITIARTDQISVHRQLIQEAMTDVAFVPLYWEQRPFFVLNGATRGRSNAVMDWNKP